MGMDAIEIADPPAPELFPAAFPREGFPRYDWSERPAELPVGGLVHRDHSPRRPAGRPAADRRRRRADLRPDLRLHRRERRRAPGRVLRLPDRRPGGCSRRPSSATRAGRRWSPRRGSAPAAATPSSCARSASARPGCSPRRATTTRSTSSGPAGGARRPRPTSTPCARCSTPACGRGCTWRTRPGRPRSSCCPSPRPSSTPARPFGAAQRPKFRVCDTMGLGLPLDAVAAPRSVPRWIRRLRELGVAGEDLEFHPHNDTHLVVANCLAAIQAGCAVVNGTLLGSGRAHRQRPAGGRSAARHRHGAGARAAPGLPRPQRPGRPLRRARRAPAGDLPAVRPRRPSHARRHPRRRAEQVLVDVRALRRAAP